MQAAEAFAAERLKRRLIEIAAQFDLPGADVALISCE
jgi:hypothetical protein